MNSTKRFPYGKCPFCKKAITIPGLDAYRCACDSWVDTALAYKKIDSEKAAKRNKRENNTRSFTASSMTESKEIVAPNSS